MEQGSIVPGRLYGFRDPPRPGEPLQRVKVLEKVRPGRWKVRFLDDPHPGLEDYVRSRNLVVAWGDRRGLLRDEERAQRLREIVDRDFPGEDHPLASAVAYVFYATGEHTEPYRGILDVEREVVERIAERAGIPLPEPPGAYTDRFGTLHLPFSAALELVQAFAAAEPHAVQLLIDTEERQLEIEAREPGNRYLLGFLNQSRAAFALARSWAGFDQQLTQRDAEIERLRRIIDRLIWDLRSDGDNRRAARLKRELKGG